MCEYCLEFPSLLGDDDGQCLFMLPMMNEEAWISFMTPYKKIKLTIFPYLLHILRQRSQPIKGKIPHFSYGCPITVDGDCSQLTLHKATPPLATVATSVKLSELAWSSHCHWLLSLEKYCQMFGKTKKLFQKEADRRSAICIWMINIWCSSDAAEKTG